MAEAGLSDLTQATDLPKSRHPPPPTPRKKKQKLDSLDDDAFEAILNSCDSDLEDPFEEDEGPDLLGHHPMTASEFKQYLRQVRCSEGFKVQPFPNSFSMGLIIGWDVPELMRGNHPNIKIATDWCELSTGWYNEQNKLKSPDSYKFKELKRVCTSFNDCLLYYLTFKAETENGLESHTFQSKALDTFEHTEEILLCRINDDE